MRKSVVTGGAGFIGSNLTAALLERGDEVVVLDDLSTGRKENLVGLHAEFVEGSIEDVDLLQATFKDAEFVFHQAALPSVKRSVEDPVQSQVINTTGTLNVLVAARDAGVRRVVYASSSSVYGDSPTLPKHEGMALAPKSPYAVSKMAAETFAQIFPGLYGLETVGLRYFNVFGPRQDPTSQYSAVVPLFSRALLRGEAPTVFGDGEQTRDFTFVDNVVSANLLAAASDGRASGQSMNIACGRRISLNELIARLSEVVGLSVSETVYGDPRVGDVRDSLADISKAKDLIGYEPLVGVEEGLRRVVDWFETQL